MVNTGRHMVYTLTAAATIDVADVDENVERRVSLEDGPPKVLAEEHPRTKY